MANSIIVLLICSLLAVLLSSNAVTAAAAVTTTNSNPLCSFFSRVKSEIKKKTNGKVAFDGSFARSVLSIGTALDVANGVACLVANKALGTTQTFTPQTGQLLGVAFLSVAAGKLATLYEGSEETLGIHCRNAMLPLGILTLAIATVPIPIKFNRMGAVKAIAAPLTASAGLTLANYKAWKDSVVVKTTKN